MAAPIGALGVAALIAMSAGKPEIGARLAGAAAGLASRGELTNAMIEVLHMPDPVTVARERLGEAAELLLVEGAVLTAEQAVALACH